MIPCRSHFTAKCMQAVFLCLAHNLMILQEEILHREHGITNKAEDRRRAKRLTKEKLDITKAGRIISPLREALQRCTQRSVKFIRWLRSFLFGEASWDRMLAALRNQISGTGLGLMIAKRCAEIHGGTLEVASTVGEGTTVTVTLKVQPPPS